jgi:hypothetical protein
VLQSVQFGPLITSRLDKKTMQSMIARNVPGQ